MRRWQRDIESTLRTYLEGKYPREMQTYMRFRVKVGPNCAYCKAAANIMFKYEAVGRKDFLNRFESGDWDGYI